jgi:hypothetical protein
MRGGSRQAVLESISRGSPPATKLGNQWLIAKKNVAAFVPHAADMRERSGPKAA